MAWIKSLSESRRDPITIDFAAALGVPVAHAIGLLNCFLATVLEQTEMGDITTWSDAYIASAAGWELPPEKFTKHFRPLYTENVGDRVVVKDWPIYVWTFLQAKYHARSPKFLKDFSRLYRNHAFFRYKVSPGAAPVQPQGRPGTAPVLPRVDLIRGEENKTGVEVPGGTVVDALKTRVPPSTATSAPTKEKKEDAEEAGGVFLSFPTNDPRGEIKWPLTKVKVEEYLTTFPDLDVVKELRRAWQWAVDNPAGRKSLEETPAFVNGWLNNSQNGMGRRHRDGPGAGPTPRTGPNGGGRTQRYDAVTPISAAYGGTTKVRGAGE